MIAGLLLAAGASTRFTDRSGKLLADLAGRPVIRYATDALGGVVDRLVIVLPGDARRAVALETAVAGSGAMVVRAHGRAMADSIRSGVRALPSGCDAVVIALADQPFVEPTVVPRLIARWMAGGAAIVAPNYQGVQGTPVLFDRSVWPELERLDGDAGARSVVACDPSRVALLDLALPMPRDVDTMADLAAAKPVAAAAGRFA